MRIAYAIAFEHELLIGSGTGLPGVLDNVTLTDPLGLPYVPRHTLKGILRDTFRRLGIPEQVRERCFGSEFGRAASPSQEGRFRFSDARHAWASMAHGADFRRIETRTRTRVKIDEETRAAEEDKLFTFELGQPSANLVGCVYYEPPNPVPLEEQAHDLACMLLALRCVMELGGWRRKGVGACRIIIDTERTDGQSADILGANLDDWHAIARIALGGSVDARPQTAGDANGA